MENLKFKEIIKLLTIDNFKLYTKRLFKVVKKPKSLIILMIVIIILIFINYEKPPTENEWKFDREKEYNSIISYTYSFKTIIKYDEKTNFKDAEEILFLYLDNSSIKMRVESPEKKKLILGSLSSVSIRYKGKLTNFNYKLDNTQTQIEILQSDSYYNTANGNYANYLFLRDILENKNDEWIEIILKLDLNNNDIKDNYIFKLKTMKAKNFL